MTDAPRVAMLGQAFMGARHAHALITLAHMTGIRPRLVALCALRAAGR